MFTRLLALPIILALAIFVGLALIVDDKFAVYIIPLFLFLALFYVFHPQIDWWWYRRNPPDTDKEVTLLLERLHPFYQKLTAKDKQLFRSRLQLYLYATEFIPQGWANVPDDIRAFVAANIIHLTFGREDYRLKLFERIVVYPKPFPSRQYPKEFHSAESYLEDGVLLFAAEQLIAGTTRPTRFYNVALHEYAVIFLISYPQYSYPDLGEKPWDSFEEISSFSREKISKMIGLAEIEPRPVSICLFLCFPKKYKEVLPRAYEQYKQLFNLDPSEEYDPISDRSKVEDWYGGA